jgi:hypothetical protein
VLKCDEAFYGSLRETAAIIAVVAMWAFSKQLSGYSVTKALFWLAVAGAILTWALRASFILPSMANPAD